MRIFITGISGLLGSNFAFEQRNRHKVYGSYLGHPFSAPGIIAGRLDITSRVAVVSAFASARPDLVIHTAGLTNVDDCEINEARAIEINAVGARNVAAAARTARAQLVHISTDHLWNDRKPMIDEDETPQPLNAYARSKLLAEQYVLAETPGVLVLRTNFFGWGTTVKGSLAEWVLAKLSRREPLRMFHDVFITPILINDLVDLAILMADKGASGVYHVCGRDRVSKYEFGMVLAKEFGYPDEVIEAVSVKDVSLVAPRPNEMSLSCIKAERFIGRSVPSLVDGFRRMVELRREGWARLVASAVAANIEK